MKKGEEMKQNQPTSLIYNSMGSTGEKGLGEVGEGKGGINDDGRGFDLGW